MPDPDHGNPAAYEPALAYSLVSLGVVLSWAGRRADALTAVEEAVHFYRRLADPNHGAAYKPFLVQAERTQRMLKNDDS